MIYEEVEALAAVLRDSPTLTELEVRNGATVVRLRRALPAHSGVSAPGITPLASSPSASIATGVGEAASEVPMVTGTAPVEAPLPIRVTAALVGVFHPSRSAPIAEGQSVKAGQVLGQIEAMRLMNEVAATVEGRIVGVLVQDGQPVQYGQPLFEIAPA